MHGLGIGKPAAGEGEEKKAISQEEDEGEVAIGFMEKQRTSQRAAFALEAAPGSAAGRPTTNRAVTWTGPGKVEVQSREYPKMVTPWSDTHTSTRARRT